jgi:hypothetical protein
MRNAAAIGVLVLMIAPAFAGCEDPALPQAPPHVDPATPVAAARAQPIAVSGSGVHFFSTAVVHSQTPGGNGLTQRSTDIIRLTGDLDGYVLYHPTTVIDFVNSTLVNTGTQVFSGTIAGSEPVLLHDDTFRFDVDLTTGATTGEVHFRRSSDAPHKGGWYECDLAVVGTGVTADGDNMIDYSGTCVRFGNLE